MAETRILIVDDEKMESILMEKCVNWVPYGFRVVGSVQTAHDALTGLVTFSPDLVFCSIGMPVMDGLELSRRMKAQRPETRILIVTGRSELDYARQALQLGADDCVLRHVQPKELLAAAQRLREKIVPAESAAAPAPGPVRSELVCRAMRYIEDNLPRRGLSLHMIAPALYVNGSYLSRVFKEAAGETVTGYILRRRIEKSCELLRTTNLRVYEIAAAVGIPDAHYFGQCFKRFTGQTVNEYRQGEPAPEPVILNAPVPAGLGRAE